MNDDKKTQAEQELEDLDLNLKFSKKLTLKIFIISFLLATLIIFAFLIYKEYTKSQILGGDVQAKQNINPDSKNYTNDYWGFKFQYPGSWWPIISAFIDGDYYFASEPINFLGELDDDQAIVEVKTYNNWKGLSFADWVKDQQINYLPQGKITNQTNLEINNSPAINYSIELNKPLNKVVYWNVLAISKNSNIKYLFILETVTKEEQDKFAPEFEKIKDSIGFYTGFGQN